MVKDSDRAVLPICELASHMKTILLQSWIRM